jgi:hypothetical protein
MPLSAIPWQISANVAEKPGIAAASTNIKANNSFFILFFLLYLYVDFSFSSQDESLGFDISKARLSLFRLHLLPP